MKEETSFARRLGTTMETRTLLTWIAEELLLEEEESLDSVPGSADRMRRRTDGSYFNPSPEEIRAATRSIQAGWSEDEWLKRSGGLRRSRHWRVPRVRAVIARDDER